MLSNAYFVANFRFDAADNELELDELHARVTPCELHARYPLHRNENFEIIERCKGEHSVVLGESFPTHISVQIFVSMQPITSV